MTFDLTLREKFFARSPIKSAIARSVCFQPQATGLRKARSAERKAERNASSFDLFESIYNYINLEYFVPVHRFSSE